MNPPVAPLTEDDIAQFLVHTPGFFERHAELLASVQLTSPHGQRAISLQERQLEMLREKIRQLEWRVAEMIRHGQENVAIADKMQRWMRELLLAGSPQALPVVVARGLREQFLVPQVAVRLWDVDASLQDPGVVVEADEALRAYADALGQPRCGGTDGVPALHWLPDPAAAASVAVIALRVGVAPQAFGLLLMASPDAQRFQAGMGTDFLVRIGELASAALSRLRAAPPTQG